MRICCISDTHGKHKKLVLSNYTADVLIHAGDFTKGKDLGLSETVEFLKWFSMQPFEHKLFIAGNHELQVEADSDYFEELLTMFPTITYIHHKEVVIDGVKFYGSNYANKFYDWAFMDEEMGLSKLWAKIPEDTNVLVTHGPSYGYCDLVTNDASRDPHVGSQSLTRRKQLLTELNWHISGHIHEAYGVVGKNLCVSVLNEDYRLVNRPIIIEI